jgi:rhamnosyltransferase
MYISDDINTKKKPKVAVLLATCNGERFLNDQIESILSQEIVDVHIYIKDDCSSDGTLSILSKLKKKFTTRIDYGINSSRVGAARNFYSLISDGFISHDFEYFALSDQDDIWLPKKLLDAITKINLNGSVAYSSNLTAFWSNGKKKFINKAGEQKKYDYLFESGSAGCTYVLTREFLLEFKSFLNNNRDAKLFPHHDWLIYAFARHNNLYWYISTESFILYRQHSNNVVGANYSSKAILKRLNKLRKKEYKESILALGNILEINTSYIVNGSAFLKNFRQFRRRNFECYLLLIFKILRFI